LIGILKEGGEIFMDDNYGNQKGFTLLEVLLSIILLSIILTSFMGFFTQSAMFTKKNEQKLGTSQTAQKVINLIEEHVTMDKLWKEGITIPTGLPLTIEKSIIEKIVTPEGSPTTYKLTSPYTISASLKKTSLENLIQIKVTVTDPENVGNTSETFTYLRR
jgi:prepilin-type N-terminal cleavage/methylation domain-containing protein